VISTEFEEKLIMKKFYLVITALLVISSMVLTACAPAATPVAPAAPTTAPAAPTTAPAAPTTAPAAVKTLKVCVSWNEQIHSLIKAWEDYMQTYGVDSGPKNGIKFEWIINVANSDAVQQANNIQDCINQKVDVIVARAEDSGTIGASITAAKAANIPFITLDRVAAASGPQPTAHVGEDSYKQALSTATAFAKLLKDKGVQGKCIEFEGDLLDMNAVFRHQAWTEVEKSAGAWTTVATVPTQWKPELFYSGGLNALQAHPEANCIYTASDFTFSSIENALQAVDKLAPTGDPKHVWVAADDLHPQGYAAMIKKYIDVGTTFEVYDQAVLLVDVLTKIALGQPVDASNLVSGRLATSDMVEKMSHLYARDYTD
jgi:ribose transport system substrate-binding protein